MGLLAMMNNIKSCGRYYNGIADLLIAVSITALTPHASFAQATPVVSPSTPVGAPLTPSLSLLATRQSLHSRLADSPFKLPLIIESVESTDTIKGDVYAQIKYSFASVSASLSSPQAWCDILILHLNTKSCVLQAQNSDVVSNQTLILTVGEKQEHPFAANFPIKLSWKNDQQNADHLQISLAADNGPLSTKDYRILLEAIPIQGGETFIHFSYAYGFGGAAKILMQTYLGTIGRSKVGFTVTGKRSNGDPIYITGLAGLIERNTMRYHLAVDAYLGALQVPPPAQFEKRIIDWFTATERYSRQLHELNLTEYIDMKRSQRNP
jgi:hypothetical protein